jgi:hypothetical protein
VRRLGRDTVQLDDGDAAPSLEVLDRGHANVVSSEVEPRIASRHLIEGPLEFRRESGPTIKKQRAPTMRSQVSKRDDLASLGDIVQSPSLLTQVKARHPDVTVVVENQLLQRATSIADDGGEPLFRD